MLPVDELPEEVCCRLRGVFADIDDTLTTDGQLTAGAYSALERLHRAGLIVAPITGRPAGWCDHIARMWPVDAVVGENGAFYFRYDRATRKMRKRYLQTQEERDRNRQRLDALRDTIVAQVAGAGIASDQPYREADLAIDFREDVPPLSPADVDRVVALFEQAGATAKVSSIHVNGWFGRYDKLGMTRHMLAECFSVDLDAQKDAFAFVGDSPNDAPMFAYFPHSIGVANVRDFGDRLASEPAYVTARRGGDGFAEFVAHLLARRSP